MTILAHKFTCKTRSALLLFACILTAGCNEYWWTRGRTATPVQLVARAEERLVQARAADPFKRSDLAPLSAAIQSALRETLIPGVAQASALKQTESALRALEGHLSVESRAPFGELSAEMRRLLSQADSGPVDQQPLRLFAARTLFFLADEYSVPAPVSPQV